MNTNSCSNVSLMRAIWIASSMLIIIAIISLAQSMGFIENHFIIKIIGIAFGLILIVSANYFPKQLFPNPASKVHRPIAWLFVIAGLLYIVVWITGDTQRTQPLFSLMFAPACILTMLLYRNAKPCPAPSKPQSQEIQS